MKTKKIFTLFVPLLITVIMVVGGYAYEKPSMLKIATLMTGTTNHATVGTWAPLLEKGTGITIRIVPESKYPLAHQWLNHGTVDIDVMTSTQMAQALRCVGGYGTKQKWNSANTRLLWNSVFLNNAWAVRADSDIKTPYDLKGKKVSVAMDSPIFMKWAKAVLAWGNLTVDDVDIVKGSSFVGANRDFMEGRSDASMFMPTSSVAVEAEAIRGG